MTRSWRLHPWLVGGILGGGACVSEPDEVPPAVSRRNVLIPEDGFDRLRASPSSAAKTRSEVAPAQEELEWWDLPYPTPFDKGLLPKAVPRLRVKGNHFEDASGHTVVLRGVNISDPDKLETTGHLERELFEKIKDWGANVVRIPIHPVAWRKRGPEGYFALLDKIVVWANALELYLIIDWHSIGNLSTGMFQHPMYDTSMAETLDFWRRISFRYQGVSTIAMYELFNEPTRYNGQLGPLSWDTWKTINETIIGVIFAHDSHAIPLVAGFNWAYDLRPVKDAPIAYQGIGYVTHPYPQKTDPPFEKHWNEAFGFLHERYPLVATEIGYMPPDAPGAHIPVEDDGAYGPRMTAYLAGIGASWTAWCFDPDWPPQLISDWNYTPTRAGEHFRAVMRSTRADGAPRAE